MSKSKTVAAAALAAPVAVAMLSACNAEQGADQTTSPTTSPTSEAQTITTDLKTADGATVANAKIEFTDGYATITLETTEGGTLSPGFHGFHIHEIGKCEANSVAPGGGEPGDFLSAGGHLHTRGQAAAHPAAGDLTPVEVRSDGSARLVATTDAFTVEDLRTSQGSALMLHALPDNFANIPPRYAVNGVPGPDSETLATGDAGSRVACGVLAPATATPETTETTTITETSPVVPPPAGTTTPPTSPAPAETTSPTTTESPATTTTAPTTTATTTVTTTPTEPEEGQPGG
ncbi:superoxide dismutase[Cu-Zn] [Mycolicibacterium holsaticum]|uniref:Superoxide dismutase n=1 Tax=Mycolicibacterium holsaticum TaxID=152142 RepID=A0A1E3RYV4_9MYCO|nr:superoxide dismutase family protein [Mycolicibacterium holsaticum]ODQ94991.1 superoxide dismutase [Mycolicibacterium holsaticum]